MITSFCVVGCLPNSYPVHHIFCATNRDPKKENNNVDVSKRKDRHCLHYLKQSTYTAYILLDNNTTFQLACIKVDLFQFVLVMKQIELPVNEISLSLTMLLIFDPTDFMISATGMRFLIFLRNATFCPF